MLGTLWEREEKKTGPFVTARSASCSTTGGGGYERAEIPLTARAVFILGYLSGSRWGDDYATTNPTAQIRFTPKSAHHRERLECPPCEPLEHLFRPYNVTLRSTSHLYATIIILAA